MSPNPHWAKPSWWSERIWISDKWWEWDTFLPIPSYYSVILFIAMFKKRKGARVPYLVIFGAGIEFPCFNQSKAEQACRIQQPHYCFNQSEYIWYFTWSLHRPFVLTLCYFTPYSKTHSDFVTLWLKSKCHQIKF